MNSEKMLHAWRRATVDLDIKIQTPFVLITDTNTKMQFDLLVEEFGTPQGTIILSIENMSDIHIPEKYGYYCSALNPDAYSTYDRQHFIDTLNDWKYFGDRLHTPTWYTGKPWSQKDS